jgi:hypothetical protein
VGIAVGVGAIVGAGAAVAAAVGAGACVASSSSSSPPQAAITRVNATAKMSKRDAIGNPRLNLFSISSTS